jgi:NADP-dependent aldehyde dehydrogenase
MVFFPQSSEAATFTDKLRQLVVGSAPFHLLTKSIYSSYDSALAGRKNNTAVRLVAEVRKAVPACGFAVGAALFETDADTFLSSDLDAEIFGPTTLLVSHSKRDQILEIARSLEGQLTATIHGTAQDLHDFADLISILEGRVGRLVFNGFPTGVEVCPAMVHGGPYPSTSDGRSTSVGTRAIFRFTRPVCYQGFPDDALPEELKDSNRSGIWRMVDGQMTREATVPASLAPRQ